MPSGHPKARHYYTSGDCARVLGLSIGYVYKLIAQGALTPSATAGTNLMLFDPAAVEQLARDRNADPPRRGRPPTDEAQISE